MKKLAILFLLLSGINSLSAQSRTTYCPQTHFSRTLPNIPLHLTGSNGYGLLNGKYFLSGSNRPTFYSTVGTVYATDLSNYCSQTHWIAQGKTTVLPQDLLGNVWRGAPSSGILIDSNFQAWIPQFSINGVPTGFNKKSPLDSGEAFIAIFNDRLLSDKHRLYNSSGSGYLALHLDKNVAPSQLSEFTRNLFWHNDSTLIKYQDTVSNGNLYPTDTIALPTPEVRFVSGGLGYIASTTCIYEYKNGNWDSLFVLDTSTRKHFNIQEFTSSRILLKNSLLEEYLEIDYAGQTSWKGSKDGFNKPRTIPDTLFADFNGRYLARIGGHIHSNRNDWDEHYTNLGVPPSFVVTSINSILYSWANDTVFVKEDSLSPWKPWLSGSFGVDKLEYNERGNLLMLNDSGYYEVSTISKAFSFHHYPCTTKPTFARYIKNGGFVMECQQGAYIQDTVNSKWKRLIGLNGIQTMVFAGGRAVAIDQEALKYSVLDSFVFDSIKLAATSQKLPVDIKKLEEPTLLSIHESILQFILFGGSAEFNIQFSIDASDEMNIGRYIDFDWGYAPHQYLSNTVDGLVGYEPFEVQDALFNGNSLTVLSDVGLVRYDCSSGKSDPETSEIQLYPNPASTEIHFDTNYDYSIYDLQGRKVQTGSGTLANVSNLNKGLYLIRLQGEDQETTGRFVKQ